jgi:hypothetical protein
MIGTGWTSQHHDITARIAPLIAEAGKRAHELADMFERDGIEATPAWDGRRLCWGIRVTEPANDQLHMHLWLRDGQWLWVPGCPWHADADDYRDVVRFATAWVTEHRVAL